MAASATKIYYPTAKAINKVYLRENRTDKKKIRHPSSRGKVKSASNPKKSTILPETPAHDDDSVSASFDPN
jgi:hypothetical protein